MCAGSDSGAQDCHGDCCSFPRSSCVGAAQGRRIGQRAGMATSPLKAVQSDLGTPGATTTTFLFFPEKNTTSHALSVTVAAPPRVGLNKLSCYVLQNRRAPRAARALVRFGPLKLSPAVIFPTLQARAIAHHHSTGSNRLLSIRGHVLARSVNLLVSGEKRRAGAPSERSFALARSSATLRCWASSDFAHQEERGALSLHSFPAHPRAALSERASAFLARSDGSTARAGLLQPAASAFSQSVLPCF